MHALHGNSSSSPRPLRPTNTRVARDARNAGRLSGAAAPLASPLVEPPSQTREDRRRAKRQKVREVSTRDRHLSSPSPSSSSGCESPLSPANVFASGQASKKPRLSAAPADVTPDAPPLPSASQFPRQALPLPVTSSPLAARPLPAPPHPPAGHPPLPLTPEPSAPLTGIITFEDALPWVTARFNASRAIPGLGSPTSWPAHMKAAWASYLGLLAERATPLLLNPTSLGLCQVAVWFLEAPSVALSPYFRKDKPRPLDADDHDIPPSQDSAKSTVRAAVAALKNGDFSKAFKHLVGNGLAPPTEQSFEALQKLFPTRDYALQLPSTQDVPQLNVELADVKKILFGESHHKKVSADAFGWSKALLALNRAAKSTPGKLAFHELLAIFIQKVVNIQSLDDPTGPPPVVGFLLKAGLLFGANKDDLPTQAKRDALGQPHKYRPLVASSIFCRLILSAALKSQFVTQVIASLQLIQVGVGTPNGSVLFSATAQAAYVVKALLAKEDNVNCFQNIDRQAAINIWHNRLPNLTVLFLFFYGFDAVAFFRIMGGSPGLVRSMVGFSQGCNFGSLGTALVLDVVHRQLLSEYPTLRLISQMDDLLHVLPQPDVETYDEWQRCYVLYAQVRTSYRNSLWEVARMELHPDKGALLLPEGAPDLHPNVREMFPHIYTISRDGFGGVSGSFCGSDSFRHDSLLALVHDVLRPKVQAVLELAVTDRQLAMRLMLKVVSKLFDYQTRCVSPHVLADAAVSFDNMIRDAVFKLLTPDDGLPPTS